MQRKLKYSGLAVLAALAMSNTALAAGFQINELSPSLQGTALAGDASASDDVSSIYFNPATLSTLKSNQVYVGASEIMPIINMSNAKATVTGPLGPETPTGWTSQGNIAKDAFVPNFYAGMKPINGFAAGIAVNAPYGMATQYDTNWVGSNNGLESSLSTLNIAPTVAYQVTQMLSVGAALDYEQINVDYSNTDNYVASIWPINADYNLNSTLSGSAWGTGWTAGFLFTPFASTKIGVSYHSKLVEHINNGSAHTYGSTTVSVFGVPTTTPINVIEPASTTITLPAEVIISLDQAVTQKLQLMASAQWTEWSSMNQLNISSIDPTDNTPMVLSNEMDWHNVWLYSIGDSYQLTQKWLLRSGLAYDFSPVSNTFRDVRIPDADRIWASAGFGYEISKNFETDFTYTHIFMKNSTVNSTQTGPQGVQNYAYANYSGTADIVALGLRASF